MFSSSSSILLHQIICSKSPAILKKNPIFLRGEESDIFSKNRKETAMDETYSYLIQSLKKPSFTETFVDILLCAVPIWLAVMIGLLIGWSWRPRWTGLIYLGFRSKLRFLWTAPPGFGARRLWLAFTALSAFSVCRTVWSRRDSTANKSANGSAPTRQGPGEESLQSDETGSVYYRTRSINVFFFFNYILRFSLLFIVVCSKTERLLYIVIYRLIL